MGETFQKVTCVATVKRVGSIEISRHWTYTHESKAHMHENMMLALCWKTYAWM